MKVHPFRLAISVLVWCVFVVCCWPANTKQEVSQVTTSVSLTTAVDYTITSTTPFTTTGSVNIENDEAVVWIKYVKPSVVISTWLNKVLIHGEAAVDDKNCRITLHDNGCIIYPHPNSGYHPLTVYKGTNFTGDSRSAYAPDVYYKSLGDFDKSIQSFKLKRGYAMTLSTNTDGKGYSRFFIAQGADLEVSDVGKYLRNKVSFIRIFPWNRTTKKGYGGTEKNILNALNVTWFYGWNAEAGQAGQKDYEYVPHHHHEGWPTYSTINGIRNVSHVLGNNEPDNSGDDNEQYIAKDKIESTLFKSGSWQQMYESGLRVGSPAMSGDVSGWLVKFMELASKYNCRIDFMAFHCYWYNNGDHYNSQMNTYYSMFHRPLWITEFNYGANWTSWARDDKSASDENQRTELSGLKDIVSKLESNPYVERYAIYNKVQDCRAVYLNGKTTLAGDWYRDLKSNQAYTNVAGYVPGWTYSSPTNLQVSYSKNSHRASFTWTNTNGAQSDTTYLERKLPGSTEFVPIAKFHNVSEESRTYEHDDLTGMPGGTYTYRIHNFDSDGKERYTGEAQLTIGGSEGSKTLQYGTLTTNTTEEVPTDFSEPFDETPALFTSVPTNRNSTVGLSAMVTSLSSVKFAFKFMPWQYGDYTTALSNEEELGFMALPFGTTRYGDIRVTVGSTQVNCDTIEVEFDEPFEEGVVPVVITSLRPIIKSIPIMTKVWDITPRGFKCTARYQKTLATPLKAMQTLNYVAMTPGQARIGDGKLLTAGHSTEVLFSNTYKLVSYKDGNGENYQLRNPILFANTEDHVIDAVSLLRRVGDISETHSDGITVVAATRLRRQVDSTSGISGITASTGERVSWLTLSDDPDDSPIADGIDDVVVAGSENPLHAYSRNGIIFVEEADDFEVYSLNGTRVAPHATQAPGIYIVRHGKQTTKVMVR